MVIIKTVKSKHGHRITGKGHAYEAHKADGNLVCAAVSTVAQTLAYYIYKHEARCEISTITLNDGDFVLDYKTDDGNITQAIDAICNGFEMLSDSFPYIVKYDIETE